MVDRGPAARAVLFEHGGVDHPQERPLAGIDEAQSLADLQPGGAEQLTGLGGGPAAKKTQSPGAAPAAPARSCFSVSDRCRATGPDSATTPSWPIST